MPGCSASKRRSQPGHHPSELRCLGQAVKEQILDIAVALAELFTAQIKLRQAKAEAQRLALLDKLNAALDDPKEPR